MVKIRQDNFDIGKICVSGQCFRMYDDANGRYHLVANDKYLEIIQDGNEVIFDTSHEEYEDFWRVYFDIDRDYDAVIDSISHNDSYLLKAAEEGYGIRILRQDLWEMIVSFLISQRNNITRIRKCIENICSAYGEERISKNGVRYHAFPTPEALAVVSTQELMGCNLGYRAAYVSKTAKQVASGEFSLAALEDMDYISRREKLMTLYGVGPKVADCICLFALGDTQSFPVDTHILQAINNNYDGSFPIEQYGRYAGILQQYIFYHELFGQSI